MNDTNKDQPPQEEELVMDTSKMNEGERQAMEMAEAAREKHWAKDSFVAQLFMGTLAFGMISPFPAQSEDERKEGDAFVAELSKYMKENLDADEVDRTGTIPKSVMDDFFKMGVFAMKIPKEYGGLGMSQVNYNRAMLLIASHCASTAVLVSAHQSIGVPQPLKMFGTEEQKKKYLPRFRVHSISAFALTEPDVGSDPARMTTEAILSEDGKTYTLNGTKQWCTNAPIADLFVVMAKTQPKIVRGKERQQITAFIVERNYPGVEIIQRCRFMGLAGMENGLVKFTDVQVPAENIILGEGRGLKMALATLNIGRLTLPAACTGAAKQCLSIARRFANKRVQWGKPIGRHEFGTDKIAFISSTTFAMEAVTWLSSHFADCKDRDIRLEAAMAKLFCSEAAWQIVDKTMQICGGRGYETALSLKERGDPPYPVERLMRDCRINTIIEGTSEIMHLFMAREAMDPHFKLAGDLMRKSVPLSKKLKSFVKMMGFYMLWYPKQWIAGIVSPSHGFAAPLATHVRYMHRTAHKLARTLFHCMAVYQARLEKKQMILGHLVEIGMDLFTMAAVCSYTKDTTRVSQSDQSPKQLADLFCRQARRRISDHFRALHCNDTKVVNKVANEVLDNKVRWLEDGIVWIGPDE